ncbi:unnamed protein product [Didymodactylos carnosus]|uniref:Uncharacterized protein n=1 Tax=Didymodactylos carnosus TaxID=1234261 RepID=A0A815YA79_9BILA|nr:unnamed protein product [Didymodactylos carnosus]CAF1567816.1 unnamed protein product [Didymodactylos carnosus]CAF4162147.1 unnamed protein product [Didymodactylos carnosus]CAF4430312.1 unnamed protein product [Didymodactylos carnosus]
MSTVTCENDSDYELISQIQQKLVFDKLTPSECTGEVLNGLMLEWNQLKAEITDESKTSFHYDAKTTEKVRFDTEATELKDRDGGGGNNSITALRIRRQQSSDRSLNSSPRKKTGKIRIKAALDILYVYRSCYLEVVDVPIISTTDLTLKRISGTSDDGDAIQREFQAVQNHPSVHLSRSITVTGDRSPSVEK